MVATKDPAEDVLRHADAATRSLSDICAYLREIRSQIRAWNVAHEFSRRVLILDDERNARETVRLLLQRALDGVIVDACASVVEAKALWSEHRHGVVLVDLVLEADSTCSIEFIKTLGRGPRVLIITGYDVSSFDEDLKETARNVDAIVMLKPVNNLPAIVQPILDSITPKKFPTRLVTS